LRDKKTADTTQNDTKKKTTQKNIHNSMHAQTPPFVGQAKSTKCDHNKASKPKSKNGKREQKTDKRRRNN
jgi:hypothetical protein